MKSARIHKAFTLIELLVVIGILAILLTITLIAINPAKQFSQANNTKRSSDVNAILNAVHQYGSDHKGNLAPLGIPTTAAGAAVIGSGVGQVNLCALLVPEYMAALPVDPLTNNGASITDCTTSNTNYTIVTSATNNRVTVAAPAAELLEVISVTK